MNLRITGTKEELEIYRELLETYFADFILDISRFYPNRDSKLGRIYVTTTTLPANTLKLIEERTNATE